MEKFIAKLLFVVVITLINCSKPFTDSQCLHSQFKVSISWNETASTLTAKTVNGSTPFTYKWSTGHTNFQTINIQGKGTFGVTVTDNETCSAVAFFEIK